MKKFLQKWQTSFYLITLSFSSKFFSNSTDSLKKSVGDVPAEEILVQLTVIDGKLVLTLPEVAKLKAMCEPLSSLTNGLYMVKLTNARDFIVHKTIKSTN